MTKRVAKCPHCGGDLSIHEKGVYKCSDCKELIQDAGVSWVLEESDTEFE